MGKSQAEIKEDEKAARLRAILENRQEMVQKAKELAEQSGKKPSEISAIMVCGARSNCATCSLQSAYIICNTEEKVRIIFTRTDHLSLSDAGFEQI